MRVLTHGRSKTALPQFSLRLFLKGFKYIWDSYPVFVSGWLWILAKVADWLEEYPLYCGHPFLSELDNISDLVKIDIRQDRRNQDNPDSQLRAITYSLNLK